MSRTDASGPLGTGWRLEVYESLPSTSDALLARVAEPEGLAILAHRQTAGRGSHGRAWVAPAGNLNLSLLLRPRRGQGGPWALTTAVAVHEALAEQMPASASLRLKWPNDLLLDGRKLGGILVEAGPGWVVIGIGINLQSAPTLAERSAASLADAGIPAPSAEDVARSVLVKLGRWLDVLANEGFEPICAAWLAAAHPCGTRLRVQLAGEPVDGIFAGLTGEGALLLRRPDGVREVHAGEILAELS